MQIDFHHAVTYVAARLAGFEHGNAEVISYCAQYVDDAINGGTITFDNNAMYTRICSAHRMLDTRNWDELQNHHVWIPFHFLPGNGGLPAGGRPAGGFIEKIICRPGSPVAMDMVQACIADKESPYGLHRLGITMHVYADTWAHQGFAGVIHEVNRVSVLDDMEEQPKSKWGKFKEAVKDLWTKVESKFVKDALPLGHGSALAYPDMPYLQWKYRDYKGNRVRRDNTEDFMAAAEAMCRVMQRYRNVPASGIPGDEKMKIRELLSTIQDENGDQRHAKWLQAIEKGFFSFGPVRLDYQAKGLDSWKCRALGTPKEIDAAGERYRYSDSFLTNDWKMFHDALQAHRFAVIYDILPRYGICAA